MVETAYIHFFLKQKPYWLVTRLPPLWVFRHLQQEEIPTRRHFIRTHPPSPRLKGDSQSGKATHLELLLRRGWARGSPSKELHTAYKHTTSTLPPPRSLKNCSSHYPGPVGFYSAFSFTRNQALSGACEKIATQHS